MISETARPLTTATRPSRHSAESGISIAICAPALAPLPSAITTSSAHPSAAPPLMSRLIAYPMSRKSSARHRDRGDAGSSQATPAPIRRKPQDFFLRSTFSDLHASIVAESNPQHLSGLLIEESNCFLASWHAFSRVSWLLTSLPRCGWESDRCTWHRLPLVSRLNSHLVSAIAQGMQAAEPTSNAMNPSILIFVLPNEIANVVQEGFDRVSLLRHRTPFGLVGNRVNRTKNVHRGGYSG